jgi:hypothetical protein
MLVNRLYLPRLCLLAGVLYFGAAAGSAQDAAAVEAPAPEVQGSQPIAGRFWSLHFQATSIGQQHGWFYSPYEGVNSLPSHPDTAHPSREQFF